MVLTDDRPDWRPARYEQALWGCRALLEFPSVKLLDYRDRVAALEASDNPFALVVLAQLAATATRRDPATRLEHKIGLTRRLYRRGLEREDILSLYAFIDWVLALPDALEEDYHRCIQTIEEAEHMQYVTTAERIGIQKGRHDGRQEGRQEGCQETQRQEDTRASASGGHGTPDSNRRSRRRSRERPRIPWLGSRRPRKPRRGRRWSRLRHSPDAALGISYTVPGIPPGIPLSPEFPKIEQ
ncbi:hypothetical protein [uncultured Thiodictyon sp.]|uniref:hypothetical protein n=1 Tax=uncultured Thiodictyon sp. TaxID=1846217 RepID=UPI0025F77EF9|nr:hypothetical protein [uncultured Thiodictyon sp.]